MDIRLPQILRLQDQIRELTETVAKQADALAKQAAEIRSIRTELGENIHDSPYDHHDIHTRLHLIEWAQTTMNCGDQRCGERRYIISQESSSSEGENIQMCGFEEDDCVRLPRPSSSSEGEDMKRCRFEEDEDCVRLPRPLPFGRCPDTCDACTEDCIGIQCETMQCDARTEDCIGIQCETMQCNAKPLNRAELLATLQEQGEVLNKLKAIRLQKAKNGEDVDGELTDEIDKLDRHVQAGKLLSKMLM